MPDVYATITDADEAVLRALAERSSARRRPAQAAIREDFLADVPFTDGARVVEVGCGTGPVARALAALAAAESVVGVDPSPFFLQRARELGGD